MMVSDIQKRLNDIRSSARNPQMAEALEKQLFIDVLRAISELPKRGGSYAILMAFEVLKSRDIVLSQWNFPPIE